MQEQIAETGNHPTTKDSVAEALWRASCSTNAIVRGTAEGVKEELYKEIVNKPFEAGLDAAAGVAFGLAVSAMPRWIAVPCALAAGASIFSFASRGAAAIQKCAPSVAAAAESPEEARQSVANNVGPIVTEGLYMAAASALTAGSCRWLVSKSSVPSALEFLRPDHLESNLERSTIKNDLRLVYGPDTLLSFASNNIADALGKPFSRLRFKSVSIENLVYNEKSKRRLINRLPDVFSTQRGANEIAIPTQFRQYRQVGLSVRQNDDPLSKMYLNAKPSIVRIGNVDQPLTKPSWDGTGFFISAEGKIATALHVVENCQDIRIRTSQGRTFQAELVAHDFDRDLALLQVQKYFGPFKPIALADTGRLSDGEKLFVLGYPAGSKGLFVSPGLFDRVELGKQVVNHVHKDIKQNLYAGSTFKGCQYFVHSRGGNSGGPVLNSNGEVIAVHTRGGNSHFRSIGTGTAVEELKSFLERSRLSPSTGKVWKISNLPLAKIKPPTDDFPDWDKPW